MLMLCAPFVLQFSRLRTLDRAETPPLIVLDLDAEPRDICVDELPPCPVIGIGSRDHPLADHLDVIVESPVSIGQLIDSILANPFSAAICVQLLRLIAHLPVKEALVAESLAMSTLQGGAEHRAWLEARVAGQERPPGQLHMSRENDVLHLVIDRPAAWNAIDVSLRDGLREAFDLAVLDDSIARIELSAVGKAFGTGAELGEFGTTTDPVAAHGIRLQTLPAHAIVACPARLHVSVQGLCVGSSLELAAFADRLTARSSAIFQLPELKMGLIPGAGGCVSLSRRIGRQRAALLMLSGRRIGARTALDWGLIDAIID